MLIEHVRFPLERRLLVLAAHQLPHVGGFGPREPGQWTTSQLGRRRHAAGQGGHTGLITGIGVGATTTIITMIVLGNRLLPVTVGRRVTFGVPTGSGRIAGRAQDVAVDGGGTSQREDVELGRRRVALGRTLRVRRVLAKATARLDRRRRWNTGRGTIARGHTGQWDLRCGRGRDGRSSVASMALGGSLVFYVRIVRGVLSFPAVPRPGQWLLLLLWNVDGR